MAAVLAYVPKGDYVLLMRRGTDPYKYTWSFPGGVAEKGETPEEACVRETKEETGLDVEVLGVIGSIRNIDTIFLCKWLGGMLRTKRPESVAVGWFPLEKDLPLDMPPFIRSFLNSQFDGGKIK